jgi:hypothetical protein
MQALPTSAASTVREPEARPYRPNKGETGTSTISGRGSADEALLWIAVLFYAIATEDRGMAEPISHDRSQLAKV